MHGGDGPAKSKGKGKPAPKAGRPVGYVIHDAKTAKRLGIPQKTPIQSATTGPPRGGKGRGR
jgi:hypothetical protein